MRIRIFASALLTMSSLLAAASPENERAFRDLSSKELIQWWKDNHFTLSAEAIEGIRKELQHKVFKQTTLSTAGIDIFQKLLQRGIGINIFNDTIISHMVHL